MRKALMPLIASLALCGTATAALIATTARAEQTVRRPVMIAQAGPPDVRDGMREDGAHRAQMCREIYAHKVGELAFLEAKLSLTAAQEPLFAQWKQASLDVAKRREGDCATRERREPGQRGNLMTRLNLEETMLKRRLADIDAERPSLTAFYASLNPAQQDEFGHAAMRGMGGRMHMMGMMGRRHPGMGPDRMEQGPMRRGPMGDAPPPAQ